MTAASLADTRAAADPEDAHISFAAVVFPPMATVLWLLLFPCLLLLWLLL